MDLETIVRDINAKFDALGARLDDNELRKLIEEQLRALVETDAEWVRKMRFGPNADPVVAGSKYARLGLGVADIEFLYAIQLSAKGQSRVRGGGQVYEGPSEELERTFRALNSATVLSAEQARDEDLAKIEHLFASAPISWFLGRDRALAEQGRWYHTQAYQNAARAMDTAEAGYGQQLVGAQYVRELWEAARRESRVFSLLNSFEMTDPTAYLPVEADLPEMLFVSESTANNSANYATSKSGSRRVQVDAKKFVIHQMWSGEIEEDSIIPFIPYIRRQAELSMAHYSDSVVLNGDTTNAGTGNINLDDADPDDTKHYLAFDGIRHVGLVDNTGNSKDAGGAAPTLSLLTGAKGRMLHSSHFLDWGHPVDSNDLVRVADPETADKIGLIDEVVTVDKYGPQATVLTGELARVGGHPLISSIAMSKTEADGKVSTTGSNNTKGQVATFNRRGFVVGIRRRARADVERLPGSDQTRLVHSLRVGFGRYSSTGAAAGIEAADVLYNIGL